MTRRSFWSAAFGKLLAVFGMLGIAKVAEAKTAPWQNYHPSTDEWAMPNVFIYNGRTMHVEELTGMQTIPVFKDGERIYDQVTLTFRTNGDGKPLPPDHLLRRYLNLPDDIYLMHASVKWSADEADKLPPFTGCRVIEMQVYCRDKKDELATQKSVRMLGLREIVPIPPGFIRKATTCSVELFGHVSTIRILDVQA